MHSTSSTTAVPEECLLQVPGTFVAAGLLNTARLLGQGRCFHESKERLIGGDESVALLGGSSGWVSARSPSCVVLRTSTIPTRMYVIAVYRCPRTSTRHSYSCRGVRVSLVVSMGYHWVYHVRVIGDKSK